MTKATSGHNSGATDPNTRRDAIEGINENQKSPNVKELTNRFVSFVPKLLITNTTVCVTSDMH